jgi:hypothetical protein
MHKDKRSITRLSVLKTSSSGCCSDMVFPSTCAICGVKALRRLQRRMVYGVPTGGVARSKHGLCRRLYSVNLSGFIAGFLHPWLRVHRLVHVAVIDFCIGCDPATVGS